jgi:1,4-dihydroxy-2-naphthoyl-CoA hydrolase
MALWRTMPTVEDANRLSGNTMVEHLDIRIVEVGEDYLAAEMPVDHRTVQPFGILHGGASVALAETLGSIATHLIIDLSTQLGVGLEINANHLRSAREGKVRGIVRPIHIGGRTHVWDIRITDEKERPVCVSRLTMMIRDR